MRKRHQITTKRPTQRGTKSKAASKPSGSEQVIEFIDNCDHPLKTCLEAVREIVLSADKRITEHIKWKAPSFCYDGEDRVTFNLYKDELVLLVFHTGAKVKAPTGTGPLFKDETGLMEWVANDRALVTFRSLKEVKEKKDALKKLVKKWIKESGK